MFTKLIQHLKYNGAEGCKQTHAPDHPLAIPSAPSIIVFLKSMLMLHHLAAHSSISLSSACACAWWKADEMAS
jgi:hypothetical protein